MNPSIREVLRCYGCRLAKLERTVESKEVSISGSPFPGLLLTATGGGPSYQWYRNGSIIVGANTDTYTVTVDDVGQLITVSSGGVTSDAVRGTIPGLITALNSDPSNIVLDAGVVSKWKTISGTSGLFSASTGVSPAYTGGRVVTTGGSSNFMGEQLPMVSTTALPDALGGVPGKAFTCTGMVRDPADSTLWIANDGRGAPLSVVFHPSIVHIDNDGNKLGEIDVLAARPAAQSLQGICIDGAGTIWVASVAESALLNFTKSGSFIKAYTVDANPNGLAYDSLNNLLIVLSDSTFAFKTYNASTGAEVGTLPSGSNFDQLQWFPDGTLIGATGNNGSNGSIARLTAGASGWQTIFSLDGALAIEGIDLYGDLFRTANDAYFHDVGNKLNQLVNFGPRPIMGVKTLDTIVCFRRTAIPANRTPILIFGDAVANPGFVLWSDTTTTGIQVTVNTALGSGSRDELVQTIGDITTLCVIRVRVDLTAKTVKFWYNGTLVTTTALTNPGPTLQLGRMGIGGVTPTTNRFLTAEYVNVWAAADATEDQMNLVQSYIRTKNGL